MKKLLLITCLMLFYTIAGFSQVDCANALALTPGTPQAGDSVGQTGTFPGDGSTPTNPCNSNYNDDEYWFEYTAVETGETLQIDVTDITNSWAGVFMFEGDCTALSCVASDTNNGTTEDLSINSGVLTGGTTYKIAIANYGPPDSTEFTLSSTVIPAPSCVEPLNLDLTVLSGDTSADVSWDMEAGATLGYNWVVMNSGDDPTTDAPAASGSTTMTTATVTGLTPAAEYDFYVQSNCDTNGLSDFAGPVAFTSTAPPANDECENAIALTVNSDYQCGVVTAGSTVAATASPQPDDVTGTPNNDVWFSFVATGPDHRVSLENITDPPGGPSSQDMGMGVYDATGGCAGLTFVDDSDPNTLNLTGLVSGTTYYVRVYGWSSSVTFSAQVTFDVCVGTPPTCFVPTDLDAVFSAPDSADLSWVAPTDGTTPVGYNWEVVPAGSGQGVGVVDSGNTTGITATATGLTLDTLYDLYVQTDCSAGDLSAWVGPLTFNAGYCIPSGTNTSTYIDNFSTTGASGMNISNLGSGLAADNYANNFDTMAVSASPNESFDYSLDIVGGTVGCALWVDWNNDFDFDTSEVIFSTTTFESGPFTGTVTIPTDAVAGDYRMRVMIDWNDFNPGDDDACTLASGRGEVEDYKITVVPSSDASLSDLTVNGVTVDGFSPDVFDYTVELPAGTTATPTVDATPTQIDNGALVSIELIPGVPGSATITVIAPDGSTTQTYTVSYTAAVPPSLSDITVNGVSITGFSSDVFDYSVELADATTPTVSATATDPTHLISVEQAPGVPGQAIITVSTPDFSSSQTYTVSYTLDPSLTDATLSDLTVNGVTVDGFDPNVFDYTVELQDSNTPTVDATPTQVANGALVSVAQVPGVPGSATVTVTAPDGTTTQTYTVNYTLDPSLTDASLSDLTVNGVTVDGFSPDTFDYSVELQDSTLPTIAAVATQAANGATVDITQDSGVPGSATITVTAADGTTTQTYTVSYEALSIPQVDAVDSFKLYPNPASTTIKLEASTNTIELIRVMNMLGQEVIKLSPNTMTTELNVSDLESGAYFIQVTIANSTNTVRVIKQ